MAAWVLVDGSEELFDPAVGEGVFLAAARDVHPNGGHITLYGQELDADALDRGRQEFGPELFRQVRVGDFVLDPPKRQFRAIVANPPYMRHHRIPRETKAQLKEVCKRVLGFSIDARAGLHVFFLIQALSLLKPGGRLAFIVPADTAEGVFADDLWRWITARYSLEGVVTFDAKATPFPGVDTNPIIVLIRNCERSGSMDWLQVHARDSSALLDYARKGALGGNGHEIVVTRRTLAEALQTGLTRPPLSPEERDTIRLGQLVSVMRGIATGANNYFLLRAANAAALGISPEFLKRAISRTRDLPAGTGVLQETRLDQLEERSRPTWLFAPDGRTMEAFPEPVRRYLRLGEELGLPDRPLIRSRNPWYKTETRRVPDFLFAYLGRRSARFIRNDAHVVPLTGFLCVYAKSSAPRFRAELWLLLREERTLANLRLVGKSYGSGAIKVEPRALERLPIPKALVHKLPALRAFLDGRLGEQLSMLEVRERHVAPALPVATPGPRRRRSPRPAPQAHPTAYRRKS
jgi:hypothetical protein